MINKRQVAVRVQLDDGTEMAGHLWVTQAQRLSDLLNDGRRFLPFLDSDGLTQFLRTDAILRVQELQQAIDQAAVVDPYEILGVKPAIGDDDLAKTYHELCRQFHPDRMAQYDLPRELVAHASTMTVRIIDAYNRIRKSRGSARKSA